MLVLQGNIRLLEEKLLAQNAIISKNSVEIKELRREMALMKSEFERMINEVGANVNELGAFE
jgi:DNA-binding transcriptional regulator YiaG